VDDVFEAQQPLWRKFRHQLRVTQQIVWTVWVGKHAAAIIPKRRMIVVIEIPPPQEAEK
jgi:hypothetical protein